MKFTKIKRLISGPNYSNIELEGEIEGNETVEDADFILRTRLSSMVTDDYDRRSLCFEVESLNYEKEELKKDCKMLRELINNYREVLENNGVDVNELLYSEIPF